jgi:hypothetical protein
VLKYHLVKSLDKRGVRKQAFLERGQTAEMTLFAIF